MSRFRSTSAWPTAAATLFLAMLASVPRTAGAQVLSTPVPSLGATTSATVALSWPAVANAQRYTIQQCTAPLCRTGQPGKMINAGAATSFTVTNLTPSTKYYFYVQAGLLPPSTAVSPWSVGVVATTLAAPTLQVTRGDGSPDAWKGGQFICFKYTLPAGASRASVSLFFDPELKQLAKSNGLPTDTTEYCVGLGTAEKDSCENYYVRLGVSDATGGHLGWSNVVKSDCPCPVPAAPSNFTARLTNGTSCSAGIDFSWTAPPTPAGCALRNYGLLFEGGGTQDMVWVGKPPLPPTTSHFPVPGLVGTVLNPGVTYSYRVKAQNVRGWGTTTAPVSVTCR